MKKLLLVFLLAGLVAFGWTLGPRVLEEYGDEPGIHVLREGDVPDAVEADVQKGVAGFAALMEEQGIGTAGGLSHGVKVFAAATQEDYVTVLAREFDLSADEAGEVAQISGGWTGGSRHITAINGGADVMSSPQDRWSTTAHELFHQMQYELSGGQDTDEKALFWLGEGSADYVGALVAERLGGKSAQKDSKDTLNVLLSAPKMARIEDLQHVTQQGRHELMGEDFHSYPLSDLMTLYLIEHYGGDQPLARMADYFRALRTEKTGEAAFEKTFGVSLEDFLREYGAWWQQERTLGAHVAYTVRPGASGVEAALKQAFASGRRRAEAKLGVRLVGEYDIVLCASREDMAQAAQEWCGIDAEQAQKLAAGSLWVQSGSTVLVDVSAMQKPRERTFTMGVLATRMLTAQESGPHARGITWLDRGMGYLMGVACLLEENGGTLGMYQQAWQEDLTGRPLPALTVLATDDGWAKGAQMTDSDTLSELAQLACSRLVQEHGWGAYRQYLRELARTKDAEKAFQKAYGMSPKAWSSRFSRFLS